MQPVETPLIASFLKEKEALSADKASQLAVMSGGSVGKALTLLSDTEGVALREELFDRILALGKGNYRDLYDFIRFMKQNRAESVLLFELLLSWSRDVMYSKLGGPVNNKDKEPKIKDFCQEIPRQSAARFSEITMKYQRMIAQNVNYPIAVLCMATEYWEKIHDRNHRS
jgi:hypothetical protein